MMWIGYASHKHDCDFKFDLVWIERKQQTCFAFWNKISDQYDQIANSDIKRAKLMSIELNEASDKKMQHFIPGISQTTAPRMLCRFTMEIVGLISWSQMAMLARLNERGSKLCTWCSLYRGCLGSSCAPSTTPMPGLCLAYSKLQMKKTGHLLSIGFGEMQFSCCSQRSILMCNLFSSSTVVRVFPFI